MKAGMLKWYQYIQSLSQCFYIKQCIKTSQFHLYHILMLKYEYVIFIIINRNNCYDFITCFVLKVKPAIAMLLVDTDCQQQEYDYEKIKPQTKTESKAPYNTIKT